MQKKLFMLNILVSLTFFSCWDYSLPNRIELEVEGSIDLPVRMAASNWGPTLAKSLKEAFSGSMENGIGVEIYDVNYGQAVQAFCVYIPIKISDSFNPKDYLDGIDLIQMGGPALKIDESVDVPSFNDFGSKHNVNQPLVPIDGKIIEPIVIPISPDGDGSGAVLSFSDDFLHAKIGEGYFTVALGLSDGNIILEENEFTITCNIKINQDNDAYPGLNYQSDPKISAAQSLANQDINKKPVKISGTVTLQPKTGGATVTKKDPNGNNNLAGKLNIKMNITEFAEIDLDITNISNKLKNPDPVSLADAAKYINYIKFDPCAVDGSGEATAGIGINMSFTEILDGLAMSIKCDDLDLHYDTTPLHAGNNVFGNKNFLTLEFDGYKNDAKRLQFEINLLSSGGNENVLHLTNLKTGKMLRIKGEAKLFQHWVEAEVNMKEALGANGGSGATFPDEPIDLSSLNDYIPGFSLTAENIMAKAYLSGPAIENVGMSIEVKAQYDNDTSLTVIPKDSINFGEKQVVIADYLEKEIYKYGELPQGGKEFNFVEVINARPDDLFFNYKVEVDDTITIRPEMFVNENKGSVSSGIDVTIMLLLRMELTAGDNAQITFPDMFDEGQIDLFGRTTLEENSMFTSLNVSYINFAVNFTSPLFTGGKLFIEKNNASYKPILFPYGIPVGSSKIAVNITNNEFDIIKDNLINPDFRLEFEKGGTITIPRNIGVTSVKIEAKGKTSITLDF